MRRGELGGDNGTKGEWETEGWGDGGGGLNKEKSW